MQDDGVTERGASTADRCRGNGNKGGRLSCLPSPCGVRSELLRAAKSRNYAAGLIITSPPIGVRSIAMSVCVCLSVR